MIKFLPPREIPWDNLVMRQLQLFSGAEIAAMRDPTKARNYSPGNAAFRRDHERHRAWGLRQRHARRLRRLRDGTLFFTQDGSLAERRSDPPAESARRQATATAKPSPEHPASNQTAASPGPVTAPGSTPSPATDPARLQPDGPGAGSTRETIRASDLAQTSTEATPPPRPGLDPGPHQAAPPPRPGPDRGPHQAAPHLGQAPTAARTRPHPHLAQPAPRQNPTSTQALGQTATRPPNPTSISATGATPDGSQGNAGHRSKTRRRPTPKRRPAPDRGYREGPGPTDVARGQTGRERCGPVAEHRGGGRRSCRQPGGQSIGRCATAGRRRVRLGRRPTPRSRRKTRNRPTYYFYCGGASSIPTRRNCCSAAPAAGRQRRVNCVSGPVQDMSAKAVSTSAGVRPKSSRV
jgi:hypothetical protein